jgi:hypothetical protein
LDVSFVIGELGQRLPDKDVAVGLVGIASGAEVTKLLRLVLDFVQVADGAEAEAVGVACETVHEQQWHRRMVNM